MVTYLLYMNEELKHLFTPDPMICFTSSRMISSYFVRAKLYPIERSVGSFIKDHVARFVHMLMRRAVLPVWLQENLQN